jgi:hypothetical protein
MTAWRTINGLLAAAATALALNAVPAPAHAQTGPLPGPRTCFWFRPPVGADPYANVAYPDAGAYYWTAVFTVPEGAMLDLNGAFPHARYASFISYDENGRPVEALADYRIAPAPGSANPFAPGAARNARPRAYSIRISQDPPAPDRIEGQRVTAAQNVLHAPLSAGRQQIIIYRIYVPDRGRDIAGGVALPAPALTLADGRRLEGAAACAAINAGQQSRVSVSALQIPLAQYRRLADRGDHTPGWPATEQPTWYVQYDRQYLLGIFTGERPAGARRSEGGFFPNPDNNYIRTIINRAYGPVLVLRGRMPVTPHTYNGETVMGEGQLRYWSMCSNQGFANTRVTDCVYDEEVPLDANGDYTIVVSREADRPRNAIERCGVAWIRWADDGDGALDENAGVLQIRNMLAAPDFAQAIQRIAEIGTEAQIMGDYLPTALYTQRNAFEAEHPCPLG